MPSPSIPTTLAPACGVTPDSMLQGLGMGVQAWYSHLMVDLRDPRVDGWLGMASIWPTIAICAAYVYIVKVLGPR